MKSLTLIFTLTLLSLMTSCSEDNGGGDIALIYEYYHFTDSLGNDLSQSDTINSIKILSSSGMEASIEDYKILLEDKSVFGFAEFGFGGISYIEFNGVDIDTISSIKSSRGAGFGRLDVITYYYNGEEMATLDFIANPGLKEEIEERNTQYIGRETTNPFYVTLVRK